MFEVIHHLLPDRAGAVVDFGYGEYKIVLVYVGQMFYT